MSRRLASAAPNDLPWIRAFDPGGLCGTREEVFFFCTSPRLFRCFRIFASWVFERTSFLVNGVMSARCVQAACRSCLLLFVKSTPGEPSLDYISDFPAQIASQIAVCQMHLELISVILPFRLSWCVPNARWLAVLPGRSLGRNSGSAARPGVTLRVYIREKDAVLSTASATVVKWLKAQACETCAWDIDDALNPRRVPPAPASGYSASTE